MAVTPPKQEQIKLSVSPREFEAIIQALGNTYIHNDVRALIDRLRAQFDQQILNQNDKQNGITDNQKKEAERD